MKKNQLVGFDAVRGIAALLVFLFHFLTLNKLSALTAGGVDLTQVAQAGHIGLDIFFVLSGFLIFRSIYFNGVNWRYFQRRFVRIAPIYYFSLAFCVVFFGPKLGLDAVGLRNILSHVFFLQSFDPGTYYGINPVLWSLSIEMIFYAFLPLFFFCTRRNARWIVVGCLAMLAVTYWYRGWIMQFYGEWTIDQRVIGTENFIGRLDQFAFGILASFATISVQQPGKALRWLSLPMMLVGIGGIAAGIQVFAVLQQYFRDILVCQLFLHSLIALSTAVFLFALAHTFPLLQRIIGNPLLEWLGRISYSFYIWHFLIIWRVAMLPLPVASRFFTALAYTVILSAASYFFVERPFLQRKKY